MNYDLAVIAQEVSGLSESSLTQSGSAATAAVPAESAMTGYLWFPEETELWLLQAALQLLRPLTPLPFSQTPSKSAGQAPPQGPPQAAGELTWLTCGATMLQL